MQEALDDLVALLSLEQLERDYFRGFSPPSQGRRIFGGQVLGQALMAAGRTVEQTDRFVHSIQAYFLLGGDPSVPILFEVDRIRDGRSFTTRRVRCMQHGEAIFALSASFHLVEDGPEHAAPMPAVPGPEEAAERQQHDGQWRGRMGWSRPITNLYIAPSERPSAGTRDADAPMQAIWMRAEGRLPDDPLVHAAVVAYTSDMGLVSTIAMPHGREMFPGNFMMASLDHSLWFHRQFRADDWFLYTRTSPSAHGARGMATGAMYLRDGTHVGTVAQEGLIRPIKR